MRHYQKEQWLAFYQDNVRIHERKEMEIHLESCEVCLNIYLDIIEKDGVREIEKRGMPELIEQVMQKVQCEQKKMEMDKNRRRRRELFVYYAVAACITMTLSLSGFFNSLNRSIIQAAMQFSSTTEKIDASLRGEWLRAFYDDQLSSFDSSHQIN